MPVVGGWPLAGVGGAPTAVEEQSSWILPWIGSGMGPEGLRGGKRSRVSSTLADEGTGGYSLSLIEFRTRI